MRWLYSVHSQYSIMTTDFEHWTSLLDEVSKCEQSAVSSVRISIVHINRILIVDVLGSANRASALIIVDQPRWWVELKIFNSVARILIQSGDFFVNLKVYTLFEENCVKFISEFFEVLIVLER